MRVSIFGLLILTGADRYDAEFGVGIADTLAQATGHMTPRQRLKFGVTEENEDEQPRLGDAVIDKFGWHTVASLAFMRPLHRLAEGHGIETLYDEIEQVAALGVDREPS